MKIKIVGDGTLPGTQVINAETGERIEHITSATWHLDSGNPFATVILCIQWVPVEIEGITQIIATFPSIAWFRRFIRLKYFLASVIKRFPRYRLENQ